MRTHRSTDTIALRALSRRSVCSPPCLSVCLSVCLVSVDATSRRVSAPQCLRLSSKCAASTVCLHSRLRNLLVSDGAEGFKIEGRPGVVEGRLLGILPGSALEQEVVQGTGRRNLSPEFRGLPNFPARFCEEL